MHYLGSHGAINWLFVLAILSLTQWLITGIYVYKYFPKLGTKISNDAFVGVEQYIDNKETRISFSHDYFYIYWNIYPIIFYGFFYYLDTSWDAYLAQIIMIGGEQAENYYKRFFTADYIVWLDIVVFVAVSTIAYFATFGTQIKKQQQYIDNQNKLYWWDIRISKELFWIRFIFLFFNMVTVGFIAYVGVKVVLFVTAILSINNLILNPFNPDGYAGLKVLMDIASIVLSIYLLRATMGIVGLIDHKDVKDGGFQLIGDLYHTAYFFFGFGFIGYFIYKIEILFSTVDMDHLLSHQIYKTFEITKDTNVTQIIEISSHMNNYYEKLYKFNHFPVDLSLFTGSLFTFVLPLIVWFLMGIMETKYYEK